MDLYHYRFRDGTRNFGDDLNPILLPKVLGCSGEFAGMGNLVCMGVGTLLNPLTIDRLRGYSRKVVFSTGFGYSSSSTLALDDSYDVACVRGPLTAAALGLPPRYAVTDGAALLPVVMPEMQVPSAAIRVSFVPHVHTARAASSIWQEVCQESGISLVDPRGDCLETVSRIASSQLVLTESLHGAIVADAFRVPWVPVSISPTFEWFKWNDWLASLDLRTRVFRLPILWGHSEGIGARARLGVKLILIRRSLQRLARGGSAILSRDSVLGERVAELQEVAVSVRRRHCVP